MCWRHDAVPYHLSHISDWTYSRYVNKATVQFTHPEILPSSLVGRGGGGRYPQGRYFGGSARYLPFWGTPYKKYCLLQNNFLFGVGEGEGASLLLLDYKRLWESKITDVSIVYSQCQDLYLTFHGIVLFFSIQLSNAGRTELRTRGRHVFVPLADDFW